MENNLLFFLFFSVVSIILFYIVPARARKYLLLAESILFYGMMDIQMLPVLVGLIGWSYFVADRIEKVSIGKTRKMWLVAGIVIVVTILIFFKNVFFRMPLGISYYSFKMISYLSDVYRGTQKHEKKWVNYTVYIAFFPQILCGPITRAEDMISQITRELSFDEKKFEKGIFLLTAGLFKKLVIAERLAVYVNTVFENYNEYTGMALWLAVFFYSIQIYCDFAGYSEIVIGIIHLMGIECDKNFDCPYLAENIKEFWDRWHISLSKWLKDYIYIPLGGNRKGKIRKNINLMITFLISGFWHGNGSGYLMWGVYHGLLNMLPTKKSSSKLRKTFNQLATFILVAFGWIFFRMENVVEAISYIRCMFINFKINVQAVISAIMPFSGDYSCMALCVTVGAFILAELLIEVGEIKGKNNDRIKTAFYLASIFFFGTVGQGSFIYMNY